MSEKHDELRKQIIVSTDELLAYRGYPAHITEVQKNQYYIQSNKDHCEQVGIYASQCLRSIGLEKTGLLLGYLHDMGKTKDSFREYIVQSVVNNGGGRKVIHSSVGLQYLMNRFKENTTYNPYATLIAYAIGAHHGLFDCINENGENRFRMRVNQEVDYSEAATNFFQECISQTTIDELFAEAQNEIENVFSKLADARFHKSNKDFAFSIGMFERLLLSALIEGDRRDTAEFMNEMQYPALNVEMDAKWDACFNHLELKLSDFKEKSLNMSGQRKEINAARQKISDECLKRASVPSGIYRLNVKTGGGKTLSSLRFALAHAKKWHKKRIILVEPLISILEQNADVFHQFIGNENVNLILEHHSNLVQDSSDKEQIKQDLLEETWNSPIIITTMVQFLNTLFLGKASSIRRMHSLCDSVIIIDEVQTVPEKMLSLFNMSIQFLAAICNTTIILCSATQPSLDKAIHPVVNGADLISFNHEFWDVFKRTEVIVANQHKDYRGMSLDEIADYSMERIEKHHSLLVICNTKRESEYIFDVLKNRSNNEQFILFHLSAAMCMAHRREVLNDLEKTLADSQCGGKKVFCISTQVIEAGVDISFESVVRFSAGIENIVQSAGRCNRNGELEGIASVYVVECKEENTSFLKEIQYHKNAFSEMLQLYKNSPGKYHNDIMSDEAIDAYYEVLFKRMNDDYQDYVVQTKSGKTTIYDLLSENKMFQSTTIQKMADENLALYQAFKTAGSLFEAIDSDTTTLLVPYKDGVEIINDLCSKRAQTDFSFVAQKLSDAKPYTISVYGYQKEKLEADGAIRAASLLWDSKIYILSDGYYDSNTGFSLNRATSSFLEV